MSSRQHQISSSSFPSGPPSQNPQQQQQPPPQDLYTTFATNTPHSPFPDPAYDQNFDPAYNFTQSDQRLWSAVKMPSFQSMDSAALVAAALGPNFQNKTKHSDQSCRLSVKNIKQHPQVSSPLTELSDQDFSSDTERRAGGRLRSSRRLLQSRPADHGSTIDNQTIFVEDEDGVLSRTLPRKRYVNLCSLITATTNATPSSIRERKVTTSDSSDEESRIHSRQPRLRAENPRKKNRKPKRLIRKKPHGTRVPQTLDDANEADQMLWHWKNTGRNWEEIRQQWRHITGNIPGPSTLSVRYIKLNENFARHGAAGVSILAQGFSAENLCGTGDVVVTDIHPQQDKELLHFKREAEEELMAQLWERVAEKMKAHSDLSEYNPKDLKKRYDALLRSGRLPDPKNGPESTKANIKNENEDEVEDMTESNVLHNPVLLICSNDEDINTELANHDFGIFANISAQGTKSSRDKGKTGPNYRNDVDVQVNKPIALNDVNASTRTTPTEMALTEKPPADQSEQTIIIEDGSCEEVLPDIPPSEVSVPEISSAYLPSSPFFGSLVAYASDNE